jgi:chorismate mutase
MTTKNNKTVVTNIREIGAALEAQKPEVSIVGNRLLEIFSKDFAKMDRIKAHKDEIATLQAQYDELGKKAARWNKDRMEIGRDVAKAKEAARTALKEREDVQSLKAFVISQGREAEWKQTEAEIIMEEYVIPSVGLPRVDTLDHITKNAEKLIAEIGALKDAIEAEKNALAEEMA